MFSTPQTSVYVLDKKREISPLQVQVYMLHLRMSGLLDSLPASGLPSNDRPSVGTNYTPLDNTCVGNLLKVVTSQ